MILLVAGGRRFGHLRDGMPPAQREAGLVQIRALRRALDYLNERVERVDVLIHGAASGADTVAKEWAEDRAVMDDPHPADWDRYGKRAGPIRNADMVADLKNRALVGARVMALLTPGGPGTDDMRARLVRVRVEIRELDEVLRDADALARLQRRLELDEADKSGVSR